MSKVSTFLSCLIRYSDIAFPIAFDIVCKNIHFYDVKTRREKRQASVTKNQQFRALIQQAISNNIQFDYVLADSWFGAKDNMEFIHYEKQKKIGIDIGLNIAGLKVDGAKNGE